MLTLNLSCRHYSVEVQICLNKCKEYLILWPQLCIKEIPLEFIKYFLFLFFSPQFRESDIHHLSSFLRFFLDKTYCLYMWMELPGNHESYLDFRHEITKPLSEVHSRFLCFGLFYANIAMWLLHCLINRTGGVSNALYLY